MFQTLPLAIMKTCICLLLAIFVVFGSAASGAASFYGGSASGSSVVSGYSSVTNSGSFTTNSGTVSTNIRGLTWLAVNANVASNNCAIPYSSAGLELYDTANSVVIGGSAFLLPSSGALSESIAAVVQSNSVIEARLVVSGSCSASINDVVWSANLPLSV